MCLPVFLKFSTCKWILISWNKEKSVNKINEQSRLQDQHEVVFTISRSNNDIFFLWQRMEGMRNSMSVALICTEQWLLTKSKFVSLVPETLSNNWRHFWMSQLGILLATSGQSPGMMLNILWCTAKPPTTENYLSPHINDAKIEKH